ncbi:MAG TPA: DNA mismatch endonuclease Vsr [Anaerolineales bacterium]|nr:DNA mismatch endonuclease Vsr [Anaerolineales bacterium]
MSHRLTLQTTEERSRLMANVRQTGTWPELAVQDIVRSLGFQFTVKVGDLPGTPDLANETQRWAIFVHGCYWHAHGCHLWKIPSTNREYWKDKFRANQERDKRKLKELRTLGYSCLTVWQCELRNPPHTKRKLMRFLSTSTSQNGHVKVSDASSRLRHVASYEVKVNSQFASRLLSIDGKSFETRYKIPRGVSLKQDARSVYDQVFLRGSQPFVQPSSRGMIRAADLFSGCGGLSLGVREASVAIGKKFESAFALDSDESSLSVYKTNFNPVHALNEDIWSVLTGKVGDSLQSEERSLLKKIGSIDVCLAGPPCQGHSDLNNHTRRDDKRNHLYERVARFAEVACPSHIIIENVPTIVHGKDRALDKTVQHLEQLGYKVDSSIIDLASLGVPQRRKRHVVVASGQSISIEEIVKAHKVAKERTVRWAIADLARKFPLALFDSPSVLTKENAKRIEYLMKTGTYDLPNHLRPLCHQDDHSYVSMYGRLSYDHPAQTITSGFGSPGQGRYIHPTRHRTLTPHEAARLQFFPDSFDFSSVRLRTALANMIGNAVPMLLAFVLCLAILL